MYGKPVSQTPDDGRTHTLSRRRVLQGLGSGIAVGAVTDAAAASDHDDPGTDMQPHQGRYNVGIRPGRTDRGLAVTRRAADSVRKTIDFGDLGPVVNGRFSPQARDALERNPNIAFVEPEGRITTGSERLPWGIDRIGADQLYTVDTIGTEHEATVAVIDSGIDSDHPDLQHSTIRGKSFGTHCGELEGEDCCPNKSRTCAGHNGNECNHDWDDDFDHGTHVAGIIAADDDGEGVRGIVPGVDLLAAKIIDGCDDASTSDLADAIRWSTEQGADVINMSLVGFGGSTIDRACNYAHKRNVVLVACAGNSGYCEDCVTGIGRHSTTIAVSNMNRGGSLRGDASTGPEVELTAPGTAIYSTYPPESVSGGYGNGGGCSMAAPHVAGVAALIKDITPLSDNEKIRARLRESAENASLRPDDQGFGLVNAIEATDSVLRDSVPDRPEFDPDHGTYLVDDDWSTIYFEEPHSDPVVIAGPATRNGPDPTTVRVRNVDAETSTAEIRLQEWDYLEPGNHVTEEVSVAVFESGHFTQLNGAQAEAGHVEDVDTDWTQVSFQDYFPEGVTPIVLPQVVTETGSDAVTVRLKNVDRTGFDVRLQEQESKDIENEGHYGERVDYLAVAPHSNLNSQAENTLETVTDAVSVVSLDHFDNEPDIFAHQQTTNGADPCTLRIVDWDASGFDITIDEEQSADSETNHVNPERVGFLALERFDDESMIYETGTAETNQPDTETWHPVRASAGTEFFDPVVLVGPPTHNGDQPTTVRTRNIGTSAYGVRSFEFQLDEWEYLDNQSHITEKLSYGIFEAGTGTIGGANAEAGYRHDVDHTWTPVFFHPHVFDTKPVLLTQCTSQNGDDPVTVRVTDLTQYGFMVRLQEEEANGTHLQERVDYLAIEPVQDDTVEAGTTGPVVTDSPPTTLLERRDGIFKGFDRPPDLLADMQTFNGRDPATARFTGWGPNSFGVFIEEEASSDGETTHNAEDVGYVAFEHDEPDQISRETDTIVGDSIPEWQSVSTSLMNEPVVVMGPPTDNNEEPVTVRVRNQSIDGFEYSLGTWNYLDEYPGDEDIAYAVFEGGVGFLDTYHSIPAEAGAVAVGHRWESVEFSFTSGFEHTPVVIAQVASDAGGDAVTTRIDNVTTEGFDLRLQEEEAGGNHTRERVDYIAAEPGFGQWVTVDTIHDVDHRPAQVDLIGFDNVPNVLAHTQTFNGSDTCNLRIANVSPHGFDVYVDEEQSADPETNHLAGEDVGFIAFDE